MLLLDSEEGALVIDALKVAWPHMLGGKCIPAKRLLDKINGTIVKLGEHVFSLKLPLWNEVNAEANRVRAERAQLRKKMGVKRLPNGVGPEVPHRPAAPTLNEFNGLQPFQKTLLRTDVDKLIEHEKLDWPKWDMGVIEQSTKKKGNKSGVKVTRVGGRRRAVRLTRYSSIRPDEAAFDVMGGKIPIDRLVQAHVLRNDNEEWLYRDAVNWVYASPGEGRVIIDVYEIEP